ncbi:MAG: hypothetical protein IPJ98_15800 [Bryobacterales bacterium]|nr:hypothetical protein [Bryobacterales bacterium]
MRQPITPTGARTGKAFQRKAIRGAGMLAAFAVWGGGAVWGQLPNNPPAPGPAGQQVVVRATDPRITFTVDGAEYRGAASFFWPLGSKHILGAPIRLLDNETATPRCQYWTPDNASRFCNFSWKENTGFLSNADDRFHTVTVGPATTWYELQHTAEYRVDLQFSNTYSGNPLVAESGVQCGAPGTPVPEIFRVGVVTIGGTCYLSGGRVWVQEGLTSLNAFPFPGFVFLGWAVNATPPNEYLRQVTVNQPLTLVARFTPAKRLVMRTQPELLKVRVDRVEVGTAGGDGPCTFFGQQTPYVNPTIRPMCVGEFDLAPNSKHIIGAPSPQTDRTGKLWVFDKFATGQGNDFLYEVGQITTNNQFETLTAVFVPGCRPRSRRSRRG